ncbi:hypothetical protein M3201_17580 [Paenibacillus motobuensis]|uniref:hypothetical protein n=1 Tax=Paenibacillus TaxID=44249 RepID=UPI002041CDC8|nr:MULTISPECIES: hypothetical protein [Paenibacillus]MCM3041508.1 hypothetical protein [Paenibacillus lutimineralis]MCM3648612.1 hypothetical protein [Paenibacillus motobuensis]
MKENRLGKIGFKKTILTAAAVIGAGTLLFQGLTQAATAAEFKKTNSIPTSYTNYTTGSSTAVVKNSMPEGYKKANYTLKEIDLEYYHNQTPTSKDMKKEEAAEIGAQALWKMFNLNLEGQVIEMGYSQATESLARSSWYADVLINGKFSYCFSVDSVTGELFTIARERILNEKVSVAFDAVLAKNPEEYVALAKKLAEKYNVVHSSVKSVEYNGQGYSNNDPTISFDITGENGEIALMTFSRYDKELLGISYNTEYKSSLEFHEKFNK